MSLIDAARHKLRLLFTRGRLEKENLQLTAAAESLRRQLSNDEFLSKAPERVVASMRQKVADYEAQIAKNRAAL